MKSILTSLLGLVFSISTVTAQKISTYLTLHGGFGTAKGYDAKLSSGIGLDMELHLGSRAQLNVKPTINFRGYNGSMLVSTVKATYLDLPVNLEINLDQNKNHLFIGGGPYIGFALAGKYKSNLSTSLNTDWQKMKFGESLTDNRSPIDYGVNFTAGGFLSGFNHNIKVGVQSQLGLKNVVPKDAQNSTNTFNINLRNITAYIALGLTKNK